MKPTHATAATIARLGRASVAFAAFAATFLAGCSMLEAVGLGPNHPDPEAVKAAPDERREPDHVTVRHVLISFDKAGIQSVTRTRGEAERLAAKVEALARSGRDFADLVRTYSDDRHGDGMYRLANWGCAPDTDEAEREKMVRGFGRVAFSLEPGQIAVLPYDANDSPFGWHIIRREK
ncbi:MAG: peptidyl-prolyl cis-trans isomerase [Planctomycetes bacterium]|nr:peptidyl-prolyl cis-trans isomerase [Planctomycetota bacterium]